MKKLVLEDFMLAMLSSGFWSTALWYAYAPKSWSVFWGFLVNASMTLVGAVFLCWARRKHLRSVGLLKS